MQVYETSEQRQSDKQKKKDFRRVCGKIGISISVFYIFKIICSVLTSLFYSVFPDLGAIALYGAGMIFSCLLVYAVPILFTVIIFNFEDGGRGKLSDMYKRPKKSARVFTAFPAVYSLGLTVNLLTLLAFYLISFFTRGGSDIERSFESVNGQIPDNIYCALILTFLSVIIAPLAEEFWVRGILYDALKPYGEGTAILITSLIFGLMHGNFQMLFYTTALGLALGYVRYATGSIFATTVMHAGINLISSLIMLFLSTDTFKTVQVNPSDSDSFLIVLFYAFIGVILILALGGLISFFRKLPAVKRNGIKNSWTGVKPFGKLFIFLTSLPVLVMLALAVDTHAGQWAASSVMKILINF